MDRSSLPNSAGQGLELLVVGVAHQVVVEVPDQVDEAFLLLAGQRVVAGVEVGDQHPLEVAEQVLEEVRLPARPVQVHHVLQVRQHPDVPLALLQVDLGLVDVDQPARHDPGEDPLAGLSGSVWPSGP